MKKKMISTMFVGLMLLSIICLCVSVNASDLKVTLDLVSNKTADKEKLDYLLYTNQEVTLDGASLDEPLELNPNEDYTVTFKDLKPGLYFVKAKARAGTRTFYKPVLVFGKIRNIDYNLWEIGWMMPTP